MALLLTVNLDDAVLKTTFTFPKALQQTEVLYENQLPQTSGPDIKQFDLTYEPFAVHVVKVVFAQ